MHATQVGNGEVLGQGHVNFDNNVVSNASARASEVAESSHVSSPVTLGNVVHVGDAAAETVKVKAPMITTVSVEIHMTLNSGLTFLKGLKQLKVVDITGSDGQTRKFNFYNPFLRQDKDRITGEGLLRASIANMAKIAHSVLGREVVYMGDDADALAKRIEDLASSVRSKMEQKLPLQRSDALFEIPIRLNDGTDFNRPVTFGELFAVNNWCETYVDEDASVTTHIVHFNISLNAGALYDSGEPATFIKKAHQFLEAQLTSHGLNEVVGYDVGFAIDSTTLIDGDVRQVVSSLIDDEGYTLVSKSAVLGSQYSWIPSSAADSLFGFGCDLLLVSPSADASTADAE